MSKYIDGIHEERFDQFLKDLRSGEFQQGKHTLEDGLGRLCCLGVACIRAVEAGVIERGETDYGSIRYGDTTVDLPNQVADYLGIPVANRESAETVGTDVRFFKQGFDKDNAEGRKQTAIGFNDTQGKSFAEIADAFEAEFKREN